MSATAERYSRAIGSSHLEWGIDPKAIDTLTAAGLISENLGTALLRLRCEFDSVSRTPMAKRVITMLVGAPAVKGRLFSLVVAKARADHFELSDQQANHLVALLLEHWLLPNCVPCDGRGMVGEYGTVQVVCTACRGSKRRAVAWPNDQETFAGQVEQVMEDRAFVAERRIRKLLR